MKKTINLEAVEASLYNSIEYVNVSHEIWGNSELESYAKEYFNLLTKPIIPDQDWLVVYYHDWVWFVRWVQWKIMNPEITSI